MDENEKSRMELLGPHEIRRDINHCGWRDVDIEELRKLGSK